MLLRCAPRVDHASDHCAPCGAPEQLSIKMAVSCAVHHSAQRLSFDAAVQTVNFSNMSDDESDVPEYVMPARVVEHLAPGPAERCTSTRDRVCGVCTHEQVCVIRACDRKRGTRTCNYSPGTSCPCGARCPGSTGADHRENR